MSTEVINCEACGSPMSATDRFCPECGHTNKAALTASMPPSEEQEQSATETKTEAATASEAPEPEMVFSTPTETEREVESPMPEEPTESSETRAESIFSTPMAQPSFTEESSASGEARETDFEVPSSETRRVESSYYSDTPPTGSPTVSIGQQGYTPPPGWQSGQAGARDIPPSQPPAYSPYPMGQGETPRQGAGQHAPPQYTPPQYTPPQYAPTQNLGQYGGPPQPPAPGYRQGNPAPPGYQYGRATAPPRDPTIALLLELIGYAGFLGIGHIYAGRVSRGIALMVAWWFYAILAGILTLVIIGCFMFLAWPIVPILSGLWIKNDLEREMTLGGPYR